ncbi:transcriptional regulator, PadR-like family [Fibrisoma limi BUZ 3]|uniref:Transcriptional regulator, PadR-like family n=2 Tax=Fibrisoma limi TaxID=663275 RepID=I2GEV5_9BACT|nr:transcriptional regulator, PadR-like family [Fibrisoma limi BUZ 3]
MRRSLFIYLAPHLFGIIGENANVMKRALLGEFEEVVMLTVAILDEEAYGVTVTQEIERKTGRSVGFSTVHTTLQRLEEKGFLSSQMGGATAERGGRRKRFFTVTAAGRKALRDVKQVREELWRSLPPQTLQLITG